MLYEDVDVSVPYRGLIFLNQYNNIKCAGMPKFPSPTGDLYFSMAVKIEIAKSFKKVSVPYRGLIFLNGSAWGGIEPPYTVSVPYRGLIFLNRLFFGSQALTICFRPLPGTYISQCNSETSNQNRIVSVPYRGLIFLNSPGVKPLPFTSEFPSPTGDLYFSMTL